MWGLGDGAIFLLLLLFLVLDYDYWQYPCQKAPSLLECGAKRRFSL